MKTIIKTVCCILVVNLSALAANYAVKSNGSGNYTTIQSCASAMAAGDTCTVYAGTYNEHVTVPAGTAGNYKTITVNGSDVVTVQAFTLNSHTKLIGNCPSFPGTTTTANCGFFISNPSAPANAACVTLPNNSTDIYIRDNTMYACGNSAMIAVAGGDLQNVSYIYIQGNTLSYSGVTQAQAGTSVKEWNGIQLSGDHFLVENNDLSHYTLGMVFEQANYGMWRNNRIHDQYETEARANAHTDAYYASTTTTTDHNVIEGNYQYTGVGPNAKGLLTQGQYSPCNGTCSSGLIYRFNSVSDLGSGNTSTYGWNHQVMYNNTYVNVGNTCSGCYGGVDNFFTDTYPTTHSADLNNIFYFGFAVLSSGMANPTTFDSTSSSTGVSEHNLAYCDATGASNCSLYGQVYEQGTWTGVAGNILGYVGHVPSNNPNFVNLSGKDFHLQAGSPAISAGTYLTTVDSGDSGSGTLLVVNDATYFQDGYGLSNAYSTVNSDCIAVGTATNHVCVTGVNYATNTLTLASSISRSVGEGVYLYSKSDGLQVLTGSAPDIGAYPYGTGTTPPAPPSGLAAVVN